MKKVITIMCVAMLSVASLPSFAQFKYGVKIGVSANSVGLNLEDSDEEKEARKYLETKPGFTVGLAAEYGFSDALSLQTGLQLTNKGFKLEREEDDESAKTKTSLNYLEIPVNLAFKVSNFQVHAGPYFAFGITGKQKTEYKSDGETESEETKFKFKNMVSDSDFDDLEDDEDYMRRMDMGLNVGAGYRFGPVLLTATYSKGFNSIYPKYEDDDDDDKITNKGFTLAATFLF